MSNQHNDFRGSMLKVDKRACRYWLNGNDIKQEKLKTHEIHYLLKEAELIDKAEFKNQVEKESWIFGTFKDTDEIRYYKVDMLDGEVRYVLQHIEEKNPILSPVISNHWLYVY